MHKNINTPWILHNRVGNEASILVMYKETVVGKAEDALTAMLAVLGLYYCSETAYPQHLNGALLFIHSEILKDNVHEKDLTILKKFTKELEMYQKSDDLENIL